MSGCCRGLPAKVCWARPYGCSDKPPPLTSAATIARHEAYDALFDRAVAEVKAIPERHRELASRIISQLDTPECPSGSSNYHTAHRALVEMGISEPWRLFTHDLRFLATLLGDEK